MTLSYRQYLKKNSFEKKYVVLMENFTEDILKYDANGDPEGFLHKLYKSFLFLYIAPLLNILKTE